MDIDIMGIVEDWFVGFVDDMVAIPFDIVGSVVPKGE